MQHPDRLAIESLPVKRTIGADDYESPKAMPNAGKRFRCARRCRLQYQVTAFDAHTDAMAEQGYDSSGRHQRT